MSSADDKCESTMKSAYEYGTGESLGATPSGRITGESQVIDCWGRILIETRLYYFAGGASYELPGPSSIARSDE